MKYKSTAHSLQDKTEYNLYFGVLKGFTEIVQLLWIIVGNC
ncbi:hypothetical protein WG947_10635 [Pontibacter sp. H259]